MEYTAFYGSTRSSKALVKRRAQAELPSKDLQQGMKGHAASLTAHCCLVCAAEVVAGQAACTVAGDHFLGLQGHPEMTEEFMFKDLRERIHTGALPKDVGENALQVGVSESRVGGFHHHHHHCSRWGRLNAAAVGVTGLTPSNLVRTVASPPACW